MTKKNIFVTILATVFTPLLMVGGASAAEVSALTAAQTTDGVISYSGTAEDGVLAVSCSLLNSEGTEVAVQSVSVTDEGDFAGTITKDYANYTLKCANYDGGAWVTVALTTEGAAGEAAEASSIASPETGEVTNEEGASAKSGGLSGWAIAALVLVVINIILGKVVANILKKRKATEEAKIKEEE